MFKSIEKRKIYGTILGVIVFIFLLLGASYAFYLWNSNDDNTNVNLTISKGLEGLIIYNQGESILSSNNVSLTLGDNYTTGISTTIEFWKKETVTKTIYGQLSMKILDLQTKEMVSTNDANIAKCETVKWAITTYTATNTTETLLAEGNFKDRQIDDVFSLVTNIELNPYQTFYKVYIWLDSNAVDGSNPISGELISTLITAEASDTMSRYTEKIDNSGANYPVLTDGLIPVVYDETTSKWVKADVESSTSAYGWYDYDQKKWANAVLVTETNRSTYQYSNAGTTIADADILAFYVWIPRYKYKVWNMSKQIGNSTYDAYNTGIDIVFEDDTSSTGTISCTYNFNVDPSNGGINLANELAENCIDSSNTRYYTHPAFTFGDQGLKGFWMGKFELSSSDPQGGKSYGGGETTTLTPKIIPNVTPWRYNTISNFWKVIYDMQTSNNIYGLPTSRTNADSHMLTNMEWGAVAYLTNSKYGRCTNGNCTEVSINGAWDNSDGSSSFAQYKTSRTGCGPIASESTSFGLTCNAYSTTLGQMASTTGNLYGVYDMSGGAYEYVMGNVSSASGTTYTYNVKGAGTNFTYSTDTAKYLIPYAYGTTYIGQEAYNRGRLGDATSEIVLSSENYGGWYNNQSQFARVSMPWFQRGCNYSDGRDGGGGPFCFNIITGLSSNGHSTRAALAVY